MHLCDMTDEQVKEVFARECEGIAIEYGKQRPSVGAYGVEAALRCAAAIRAFEPETGKGG